MSNLEWRYCGRYNDWIQDAVPREPFSWIDEEEARRRYQDPSVELALIPPVDELTGIIPWYITVTTAEHPSFTVTYQQPPGVPSAKAWWKNLGDGRLFGDEAELWDYPSEHNPLLKLRQGDALTHVVVRNREDGSGRLMIREKGNPRVTTADRRFDPAPLYVPVPEWGEWDILAAQPLPGR